MVQKLDKPKTETKLRRIHDQLYESTVESPENNQLPKFKGLLEIASSKPNILTAIHKLKGNKGSATPGTDEATIRDILEKDFDEVMDTVQSLFRNYKPLKVRRVYIEKQGKEELRPLGIPAIADRVIQECIRRTIEPILEAQFFKHSYGFRPMRDAHMALNRITDIVHKTGYHWVVEGDIKGFFDNVNHSILIKDLWNMGIRDRRVLCMIKAMLKAGVMNECHVNDLGTPQGGIISPLLANVYLHKFDKWLTREWECKKFRNHQSSRKSEMKALHSSNLKPYYLVRYADDWVIITNSQENAEKLKWKCKEYLKNTLKLELSEAKTFITCIRKNPIRFVGFEFKVMKGKARHGYIVKTEPDRTRLRAKIGEIRKDLKELRRLKRFKQGDGKLKLVHGINLVNSRIRGVIEYYNVATRVSPSLHKYSHNMRYTAFKALKAYGGKRVPADKLHNLQSVHKDYKVAIPAIEYKGLFIGITDLCFARWVKDKTQLKRPKETPYTPEGRRIYQQRTGNKPVLARADELISIARSYNVSRPDLQSKRRNKLYNFEFLLNVPYAFNRDKGRCRVCGEKNINQ
ncbi:group II intron reverse transcriptase/maturase [Bacillus infantis]|uniref:group II intron reverse transcriptase/maturase n=1 Tax=Bacillus infantis TaxID=324767 RepID=UPI0020A1620E|nr:group II intron reverse transcriptase/maturase [Bacillus infantis]MCP1161413.1 group II intron reverse transcriptase/maturase [Bacillus infantis]